MDFKNNIKLDALNKVKIIFLTLIPLTLIYSIKLNSFIIIVTLLLFIPQILKNKRKIRGKQFLLYFLPLISYVLCILIGFFIDFYFGFFDLKKIERLLPFIIFPLIFLIGYNDNINKFKIVKLFSFSITVINILLLLLVFTNLFKTTNDKQFLSTMWTKTNVEVIGSDILAPNQKKESVLIIENTSNEGHDLIYNVFDNIESESEYIRSVYLKSNGRDWVLIRQYDGVEHKGVWFNITEGSIGYQQEGVIGSIEEVKNGWYRCSVINKTSKRTKRERIQITIVEGNKKYAHKGDGKSGIYVWGAQIKKGNTTSKYEAKEDKINYELLYRDSFLSPLEIHPTYYSIFVIFAILFFLTSFFSNPKPISLIITLFNIAVVIFISSKGAILSLVLILLMLIYYIFKKHKIKASILMLTIGASFAMISLSPTLKKRIIQSMDTVYYDENKELSTSDRIIVWKSIFSFSNKELLLGMGNINGDNLLKEKSNLDLNAHNQYFQALINSGIIGFFFLLIYLFCPLFFIDIKNKNNIFIVGLILLFGINFLFESVLNRQWGIVFISFFYSLLMGIKNTESVLRKIE